MQSGNIAELGPFWLTSAFVLISTLCLCFLSYLLLPSSLCCNFYRTKINLFYIFPNPQFVHQPYSRHNYFPHGKLKRLYRTFTFRSGAILSSKLTCKTWSSAVLDSGYLAEAIYSQTRNNLTDHNLHNCLYTCTGSQYTYVLKIPLRQSFWELFKHK